LLDVQFDIRMRREKAGLRGADITDAPQLLAHRCAVDAADGVGILERKAADINQAPHRIGWKARSLLIGEGDERQRPARGAACVVERFAGFEACQHAVETVIAAAGPDRVDVGAEHDGRHVLAAAAHGDDVADGVDRYREAEVAHPSHEQIAARPVLVAEREPAIAAAGQGPDAIECIEPAEQAVEFDPGRCRHSVRACSDHQLSRLPYLGRAQARMTAPALAGNRRHDRADHHRERPRSVRRSCD